MKQIPLTKGQFALVDDADYEWLNRFKWYAREYKHTFYAVRGSDDKRMHRLILGLTDRIIECDHRDRNGLNNQRNNLRIATCSQNKANRASRKTASSKYLGVCWYRRDSKWQAAIQKNGKIKYLGRFENEVEAAKVYNIAAIELHGEFANLNKI